jgi:hypothetical protein
MKFNIKLDLRTYGMDQVILSRQWKGGCYENQLYTVRTVDRGWLLGLLLLSTCCWCRHRHRCYRCCCCRCFHCLSSLPPSLPPSLPMEVGARDGAGEHVRGGAPARAFERRRAVVLSICFCVCVRFCAHVPLHACVSVRMCCCMCTFLCACAVT